MPNTNDTSVTPGVFALVKGNSGVGKSVATLSFPGIYMFDLDKKMPNIARKHYPGKSIHFDHFNSIFDIMDKIEELKVYCPHETIVVDTLTSLSQAALTSIDFVKGTNVIKQLNNIKKSKGGASTIELRSFDYYNGEDSFLKMFLDELRSLWVKPGNPRHVLLVAHILLSESVDLKKVVTKTRRIVTAGTKIGAYIPAQFDEEYYVAIQKPDFGVEDSGHRRVVITQSFEEESAKTALNIPAVIDITVNNFFDQLVSFVPELASVDATANPVVPYSAPRRVSSFD